MKILVTGSTGLVGSRFIELLEGKYEFITPSYPEFDLTNSQSLEKVFNVYTPDVVVNFAAYTNVSESENQRDNKKESCWKINVEGTKNLVSLIDSKKTHFIHISTDYVFPGSEESKGPYSEGTLPESDSNKLTWYGFSKAEAEREVNKTLGEDRTILRIIYPVRAKYELKADYLRKPLSLFDEGKLYPMFTDQQVNISFVDEVTYALEKIFRNKLYGNYHCCSSNTSTPFDLVTYLIKKARGVDNAVKPTTLDEFIKNTNSSKVRYPKFGGLLTKKTQETLGIKFSSWKEIIDELVKQGIS
ncbi:MAG: sugar nucleotide-binding protein [Patescibacteria group bacterium]